MPLQAWFVPRTCAKYGNYTAFYWSARLSLYAGDNVVFEGNSLCEAARLLSDVKTAGVSKLTAKGKSSHSDNMAHSR